MKQNESVKKLEVGKDYVNVHNSKFIVIDRVGDFDNKGFYYDLYKKDSPCTNCGIWREATESEVIEAFEKHLNHRFGEDWRTMKIKGRHPNSNPVNPINDNSYGVEISKKYDGWVVWNENGLLYCNGIWVKRLEEKSLFITEDGVEITDGMHSVIAIDSDINVYYTRYQWANKTHLIFGSKEGADEYILMNKPLLSLQDVDSTIELYSEEFDKLKQLAKEGIDNGK